jgi:peptide/nickel transport system ATP-binding protein
MGQNGDFMLQIDDVSIRFGNSPFVLKNISIDIAPLKRTCVIGESGSGKSILILSILRLLGTDSIISGRIYIDGVDLLNLSKTDIQFFRRDNLAYVPQGSGNGLNPLYTIKSQMTNIIKFNRQVSKSKALLLAKELLLSVGLTEVTRILQSYPFQLSGGMRQRVLTAIGLSCKGAYLLMDEPTKGLDKSNVNILESLLTAINNKTILCVTHDLSFAKTIADFIAVLYSSELVEFSHKTDFFNGPLHPYSEAMFSALPENGLNDRLGLASFEKKSLSHDSCAFLDRCPDKMDKCSLRPPFFRLSDRSVRCWKYAS